MRKVTALAANRHSLAGCFSGNLQMIKVYCHFKSCPHLGTSNCGVTLVAKKCSILILSGKRTIDQACLKLIVNSAHCCSLLLRPQTFQYFYIVRFHFFFFFTVVKSQLCLLAQALPVKPKILGIVSVFLLIMRFSVRVMENTNLMTVLKKI